MKIGNALAAYFILAQFFSGLATVRADENKELAKQSQNPLGTIISLPFENNILFDTGPSNTVDYVLNLKPVYPAKIGNWNLINRFILPVIWRDGQKVDLSDRVDIGYGSITPSRGSAFGLGDFTYQAFFSPPNTGQWTLGFGPAFVLPTHTQDRLGSDKWSTGPAAVALTTPGKWVVGVLAQNIWSFAGPSSEPDVNNFLFQYFINYNLDSGWYLSTTPVITANWEVNNNNRWTVPVGGGVGRLVKFGKLPVDFKLAAYWNAVKPQFGSSWSMQFHIKLLFPKK